jgi:trigger factor
VTLTIHTEEDAQRQVMVTVEVAEERVQEALQQKIRTLAREVHIPGFRKGKVPTHVLVRSLGGEALRAQVIEEMLPTVVEEVLNQADLEPYAVPMVNDLELEPLVIKMTVPLRPQVTLGDYRSIRKEVAPVEVTEEAVDEALEQIRQRHAVTEVVDRPVEMGDLARMTINAHTITADGEEEPYVEDETVNLVVDPESVLPGTPFAENVVGMSAGESREFRFTFPEDYEDEAVAGREAVFNVDVAEVSRRELPELDDELAETEGEYETLAEMRQGLRERLQKQAEAQAESDLIEGMIDDLVAAAEMVYPPAVVEREIDRRLETMKQRISTSGMTWEKFLEVTGNIEENIREKSWQESEEQARRTLVFGEFMRQEKISIAPEDVEEAVSMRLADIEEEALRDHLRQLYTSEEGAQLLTGDIIMKKVKGRIEAILSGQAPDLDALESGVSDEEE